MSQKGNNLSSSLKRVYRHISTARPSTLVLSLIVISMAIFLFGGGLYNVVRRPLPSAYSGDRFYFIYPQLSEQFITDSMIAIILYSLGVIGILAVYKSTEYAYKPKQAYMTLLVGVTLLIIAYAFLEIVMRIKLGG